MHILPPISLSFPFSPFLFCSLSTFPLSFLHPLMPCSPVLVPAIPALHSPQLLFLFPVYPFLLSDYIFLFPYSPFLFLATFPPDFLICPLSFYPSSLNFSFLLKGIHRRFTWGVVLKQLNYPISMKL